MKSYSVVVLSIGKVYAAQAGELLKILLFIRDQGIYMAYICCTVLGRKKKKKKKVYTKRAPDILFCLF